MFYLVSQTKIEGNRKREGLIHCLTIVMDREQLKRRGLPPEVEMCLSKGDLCKHTYFFIKSVIF